MTQVLTIPTPFNDFSELTENFAQRVDEERLMLPCSGVVPEGEWVQFSVLLGDGEIALAGVGRVQGAFDNGEEHPPEYRFDVVLDSLQFEGMHEVMFERLLMARSSILGAEPVTGEVSIAELQEAADASPPIEEVSAEPPQEWPEPTDFSAQETPTPPPALEEPADSDGAYAAYEEPEAPAPAAYDEPETPRYSEPAPTPEPHRSAAKAPPAKAYPTRPREPGRLPSPHSFEGSVLTRRALDGSWTPQPSLRPEPAQSSGLFEYGGPVPSPAKPPRPELDESLRVRAAPRPGAPWPRRIAQSTRDVATDPPMELLDGDASAMLAEPMPEPVSEHEEW